MNLGVGIMFNALKKLVVLAATCALCIPNVACEKKSMSIADTIIKSAQEVSDFARDQGFTYGHASINPGYNWGTLNPSTAIDPTEKLTSCDSRGITPAGLDKFCMAWHGKRVPCP